MVRVVSKAACMAAACLLPAVALADTPVLHPVQVGAETLRYDRGVPTLDLQMRQGSVQIRPLPMDHGSLAFSVAVFNAGSAPANFGIENVSVRAGEKSLSVLSVDQLIGKAKNRARWKQIGVAMLGGLAAGAAASQRDTYYGSLHTPHGSYFSTYSAPSAIGQIQATAIAAGTGYSIAAIQGNLDRTREALGESVIQTSTLDPGQSYAGKIVIQKIAAGRQPERVSLLVNWNGEQYPFAFQLARAGTATPVFTAITSPASSASAEPIVAASNLATAPVSAATSAIGRTTRLAAFKAVATDQNVNAMIARTALYMERPTELDDGTLISEFAASGNELLLTASIPKGTNGFSEIARSAASRAICERRAFVPLLQGGATIRARYVGSGKRRLGEVVVTPNDCFG